MKNQLLILGLWTILSCTSKTDTQAVTQADTLTNDINVGLTEVKTNDSVLYKREALHYFSSTADKDTFKIIVTGQSIKDGQFKFQIVTKDRHIILDESYETNMLLGYGVKSDPTHNELEEYIKTRIDKFFSEDNFHQPAIASNDTFDEDYTKKEIWDDIISDQTSVGFHYLIGEGRRTKYCFFKETEKGCPILQLLLKKRLPTKCLCNCGVWC